MITQLWSKYHNLGVKHRGKRRNAGYHYFQHVFKNLFQGNESPKLCGKGISNVFHLTKVN